MNIDFKAVIEALLADIVAFVKKIFANEVGDLENLLK